MVRKRSNLATSTSFQNAVNTSLVTAVSDIRRPPGFDPLRDKQGRRKDTPFRLAAHPGSQATSGYTGSRHSPKRMLTVSLLRTPELSLRWVPVWRRNLLVW